MVAAQDLGSCVFGRVGSSPISRTGIKNRARKNRPCLMLPWSVPAFLLVSQTGHKADQAQRHKR